MTKIEITCLLITNVSIFFTILSIMKLRKSQNEIKFLKLSNALLKSSMKAFNAILKSEYEQTKGEKI